jgi:hypothetical protein
MRSRPSSLLLFSALALACVDLSAQQVQWRAGPLVYTPAVDFVTGPTNNGTGYYVSQAYIPAPPQPVVGQRYYVSMIMSGIAVPAAGRLMAVHFVPPQGTTVVADAATPVRCFYSPMDASGGAVEFTNQVITDNSFGASLRIFGCPQPSAGAFQVVTLSNGAGTAFLFDRRDPQRPGQPVWPLGSQASYEFLIPVVSNRSMGGFAAADRFTGAIQSIQGDGVDPWAYPQLALLVNPASGGGGSADMRASITTAAAAPGFTRFVARCTNFGPDAAQNASCTFGVLPAGSSVSCSPASPQASLALNAFIECSVTFPFQQQGATVEVTAASSTPDPTPANNGVGVTQQPGTGVQIFVNGFEG